jgi:rhodanese-related sulfurtransferase
MSVQTGRRGIQLDPADVQASLTDESASKPEVIDVREDDERAAGHIEGTRHIRLSDLLEAAPTVSRERAVIFYCKVGERSQMAAEAFRAAGFDAYTMSGGLVRWAAEGRPLHREADGNVSNR